MRRGMTLAELLTGLAVTSVVLVAVMTGVVGVQGVYQRELHTKRTVENARQASAFFERVVPLAGFGLPPELAFDLTPLTGLDCTAADVRDNCTFAMTAGNRLTQPVVTDDLAFRFRDPQYLRRASLDSAPSASGQVRVEGGAVGVTVAEGQAFLVVCESGEWAAVRAAASATATATEFQFQPAGAPFPVAAASPCFQATGTAAPSLLLVQERRVRIELFPSENNERARPYLVVYRSLARPPDCLTNLAQCEFEPLAADVENFQVAWVMNRPTSGATLDTDRTQTLGDDPDVVPELPDAAAPHSQSSYDLSYADVQRFNAHPGNVRGLRLSLTLRTQRELPQRSVGLFPPQPLGNWRPPATPPDSFYRVESVTAVRVPNLASRSFFQPVLSRTTGDLLNTWGG